MALQHAKPGAKRDPDKARSPALGPRGRMWPANVAGRATLAPQAARPATILALQRVCGNRLTRQLFVPVLGDEEDETVGGDGTAGEEVTGEGVAGEYADDTNVARPVLRQGSQGPAVETLQQSLNAHGCNLGVDGSFGPLTGQAVVGFQQQNGLDADGVVGPQTWAALEERAVPPGGNVPPGDGGATLNPDIAKILGIAPLEGGEDITGVLGRFLGLPPEAVTPQLVPPWFGARQAANDEGASAGPSASQTWPPPNLDVAKAWVDQWLALMGQGGTLGMPQTDLQRAKIRLQALSDFWGYVLAGGGAGPQGPLASWRMAAVSVALSELGSVQALMPADEEMDDYLHHKMEKTRLGWESLDRFYSTACASYSDINKHNVKFWTPTLDANHGGSGHWCGIFATYALKSGGLPVRSWAWETGIFDYTQARSPNDPRYTPQPGDIGYRQYGTNAQGQTVPYNHHAMVAFVYDDGTLQTVDGNSGNYSEVTLSARKKKTDFKFDVFYVPDAGRKP